MSDLLRFNPNQKYVLFDFETCGLNLGSLRNKPWQLAFLTIENQKVTDKADYWLKWDDINVSEGAAKVTGWTQKKYEDFERPTVALVLDDILTKDFKIRRLTPLECWRLQGYPDVAFFQAQKVNSDTQLYKQAGNSITVNVMMELLKSIYKI